MAQIKEKMQEIYDKLQNGDTDTKFQIGNQEFTIKEWDHFLEKFDSVQDAIRAALEEKIEKEKVERLEEKLQVCRRQQKSRMRWIVSWPRV